MPHPAGVICPGGARFSLPGLCAGLWNSSIRDRFRTGLGSRWGARCILLTGRLPPPYMRAYIELTKPRITWLILMSTGIGYFFGLRGGTTWLRVSAECPLLLAVPHDPGDRADRLRHGGAEPVVRARGRSADAATAHRPLPEGRISSGRRAGIRGGALGGRFC